MCRAAGVLLAVGLTTALLASAPRAEALSCLAPPPGSRPDPYADYKRVFEAIALSGPAEPFVRGSLSSPARMLVLRTYRGRVPRIVRVQTAVDFGVSDYWGHAPGLFEPTAGSVARLFVERVQGGVYMPSPCVFGDTRPEPRSPLRNVPGTAVRSGTGALSWRAAAQRGPRGVHCVIVHPVGRHTGGGRECEIRRPLMTVMHEGRRRSRVDSTAVAVAGPGVASVELDTPDGQVVLRRAAPTAPLLATFPGRVDPAEVTGRATMADGQVIPLTPVGFATALWPGPDGEHGWRSALDAHRPRICVGGTRLAPRTGEETGVSTAVACGNLRRRPYFFEVEDVGPTTPGPPLQTMVVGAGGPTVREIRVTAPSGERRMTPGPGGQFLAVLPPTDASTTTIEITFADGSTVVHRGRRKGP